MCTDQDQQVKTEKYVFTPTVQMIMKAMGWKMLQYSNISDKFNEREFDFLIKKKERELILLQVHVVFIYYFYLGFNQSLRYNFICMSNFPTRMIGHLNEKMAVARFHPPPWIRWRYIVYLIYILER